MQSYSYIKELFSLPSKIKHLDNYINNLSRCSYFAIDTESCFNSISYYILEKKKLIDKFNKLMNCYLNLDKKFIDCVKMKFLYHCTTNEISDVLDISERTILRRLAFVNCKFKSLLNKGEIYGKL